MTHIVHIISGLKVGGAEEALVKLVSANKTTKYIHSLVVLDSTGNMYERFLGAGFQSIHVLDLKRAFLLEFFKLIFLLRKLQPNIIHTWLYHADLIGGLAARLIGCRRVIWNIRNSDVLKGGGISRSAYFSMKMCARLSSWLPVKIVSVSNCGKLNHIAHGYNESKFEVIPNGFDVKQFQFDAAIRRKVRRELNISDNTLVIGSIGRYNRYKDHNTFLQAAQKLISSGKKYLFLMAGREVDINNTSLVGTIASMGLSDRFLLLGESGNVNELLCAIDIFCSHSKSEGFPNALGEAMSAGRICIATDVGDTSVLLGSCGVLIPPCDSAALSKGIETLAELTNKGTQELQQAARQRIVDNFPNAAITMRYGLMYDEVMSK